MPCWLGFHVDPFFSSEASFLEFSFFIFSIFRSFLGTGYTIKNILFEAMRYFVRTF